MPLKKYYGGHGEKVMREMKAKYGEERGERIFYATANKQKKQPSRLAQSLRRKRGK